MEKDLSCDVGVLGRDILAQQKGNAVLPMRVRVPVGAGGDAGPAAPAIPFPGTSRGE